MMAQGLLVVYQSSFSVKAGRTVRFASDNQTGKTHNAKWRGSLPLQGMAHAGRFFHFGFETALTNAKKYIKPSLNTHTRRSEC